MPRTAEQGPLSPEEATARIREIAASDLDFYLTTHAKGRMLERGAFTPDILHVLRFGTVSRDGEVSSRPGVFKYRIESKTPNSEGRILAAIVIPDDGRLIKIVTVLWANEVD